MISTLTHSPAVKPSLVFLHTYKVLVTGAGDVEGATTVLVLHHSALGAATANVPHLSSRAAEISWAFHHVAGYAGQRQAFLHQQDGQKLTDQQTLQIHCGAEMEKKFRQSQRSSPAHAAVQS